MAGLLSYFDQGETMTSEDDLLSLLAVRLLGYQWFQTVLGSEPSKESLCWIASSESRQVLALFLEDEDPGINREYLQLVDCLEMLAHYTPDEISALSSVYTRLFLGPGSLPIHHWESVYRKGSPALFQQTTLEVRKAYLSEGFLPAGYPNVADDHIAIELDFMSALGRKAIVEYENGNARESQRLLESSERFLAEHLLKWADKYRAAAGGLMGKYVFYPLAIRLLAKFLFSDKEALREAGEALDKQWRDNRA